MNLYTIFQCAQLLERFSAFQRTWFPFHKLKQRLTPKSVNALVTEKQRAPVGPWSRDRRTREIKSVAAKIENDLHLVGRKASAGSLNGCAAVTIPTLRSDCNFSTTLSIKRGSIRGSSPWTLITYANCFVFLATSATRLVPLRCFRDVSATSAPHSNAAEAIRMSSVAMTTKSRFFARRQRSQTCLRSGFPAMGCSGLPGNRVESHRAGIIPSALPMRDIDGHDCCSKM